MADRMVVMHAGIAQQIGAAAELYGNPANLFVAGFIGSPAMNFLDATLRNECDLMIGELRLAQTPVPPDAERRAESRSAFGRSVSP